VSTAAYLENLNPEQRRAVEHGAAGPGPFPPLLVIAGAGSGKTNTLAHRVAHLIVNGADPRRILLMTFSRRAASEMTKRVERIARKIMDDYAGLMTNALSWAGTFTASARVSFASTPTRLAWIPLSQSTTAKILPT
jgi:DNA helicase-2/ATP-dependent DNA helicase PcrA